MIFPLLVAGFAMGFFGSPHCLGMCGGLVTAFGLSMQSISSTKKRALIATYHVGRLISYSLLGIIASLIGTAVLTPIMVGNSLPRILLGTVLVFIGLNMLGLPFLARLEKIGMGVWQTLSPLRQKVFPLTTIPRALAAGLLWGFLPCGLVYGALLMAAVGNNALSGALVMFAFGLGTVPMLVATQETVGWLHRQIGRFKLRQLNGGIMILSGIAVIAIPMMMSHGGHAHGAHGSHDTHSAHHAMSDSIADHTKHTHDTHTVDSQADQDHHDINNSDDMPHMSHSKHMQPPEHIENMEHSEHLSDMSKHHHSSQ